MDVPPIEVLAPSQSGSDSAEFEDPKANQLAAPGYVARAC